jgi:pimeloyl-ACP methyl ester carboxylesterase
MSEQPETIDSFRRTSGFAATDPAIYFDAIQPAAPVGNPPLVLVHGAAHTGSCYLQTPDGRPGWAQQFAALGYPVIVPDWPGVGRSGRMDFAELTGEAVCRALAGLIGTLEEPCVLLTHSMSGAYGWRLIETHGDRIRGVIGVAPSPPGDLEPVPPILQRGDGYVVIRRGAFDRRVDLTRPTPFDDDLVENKLVGGGDQFPRDFLDAYKRSLGAAPPRLAFERSNIEGSQLHITDTAPFKDKPALIISAEHDRDHTPDNDGALAAWLGTIGADATYWYLPDQGITGNGHMMMLEKNNADIAGLIAGWIAATV